MLEIRILRVFMTVLHIFPIKQNRIILNSYTGTQYSCNPKYITEAILKRFPDKYEIIWTFKEPDKFQFLEEKGIKVVKYASIKRFYYEATAKVSINNIGSYSWQPIRRMTKQSIFILIMHICLGISTRLQYVPSPDV